MCNNDFFWEGLPDGESFYSLVDAQVLIEQWRNYHTTSNHKFPRLLSTCAGNQMVRRSIRPLSSNNRTGPLRWGDQGPG